MAKITVKAKIDGGIHLKHGPIIKGQNYTIDEEDFGAELFERPDGFESPHEKADRERPGTVEAVNGKSDETEKSALTLPSIPASPDSKKGGK